MNPEDEYRLSFYKDLGDLDSSHDVKLVRHTETGNIYVRKDRDILPPLKLPL